ncbi:MAG: restriction endonuclease, SacI family [Tannerellaceae bacterium]|jgi:DNA adenine methylase|nr:restriction endonuclease, SacI family [Tannerellaceae bacterium]
MNNIDPKNILESLYEVANDNSSSQFTKSDELYERIAFICRCNTNKAPIRFLISCLLAKLHRPEVDIRKPYTEIEGDDTYSGRFYDERFVEPFVHKYNLPYNPTTAYLTPAFRNLDRILTIDLVLVGKPRKVYVSTLEVLNTVYSGLEKAENVLQEIIRLLLLIKAEDEKRMEQLISDLKQADILTLSSEEIVTLLTQHLNCKHSSRLPVLMIAAAYQTVKDRIREKNKTLESHHAADKQTGSIGDVEICLADDNKIVTCYEMKDRRVTKTDIDISCAKLSSSEDKIDNYIFITTDVVEAEVSEYAKSLYEKIGIEFVVLDCTGFIRHFLHFFHRQRNEFLNIYQSMVLSESSSAVSQPLKEAFLALRRVAEGDRR